MSEHDDAQGPEYDTVFHPEDGGLPCFGCYFGAVFDALSEDDLVTVVLDPEDVEDVDPEAVEYARRVGGTFTLVADAIARLAVQIAGEGAEEMLEAFHERIDNTVQLLNAPEGAHVH
jgi:hypothetical protein